VLRLRYGATQIVRRPGRFNAIRIGRELDCGLIVFDDPRLAPGSPSSVT
jgi:hypothetical protein